MRYSVLKREAIFRVVLLLSEFWKCADHFACLSDAVRWKNGTVNTMQIFPLSHYAWWEMSLKVTLDFFFFADNDVAVFSTCLKLRIQKVNDYYYRDHNKQRYHGDCAVYFMHTWSNIVYIASRCTVWHHVYYGLSFWPLPVAAVKSVPIAAG